MGCLAELVQSVIGGNPSERYTFGSLIILTPLKLLRTIHSSLAIGFMANLLGLGGLAAKVKGIIKKAQAPVNKVVDKVVGTAKNLAGKFTDKDDDDDNANEEGEKDEAWDKGIESLTRIQTAAKNKGKTETEMDNALSGIKSTHGFDRLTKSADGEYWEVTAKKGDRTKKLDIKADFEGAEPQETSEDQELEAKAQEGFAELRTKSAKFDGNGASKEDADKIARDVKAKYPVFTKLEVIDGGEDWDYSASYNPQNVTIDGADKEELKDDKNAGQLLTPSSLAAHENLKVDRDEGSSSKVGYDAETEAGTKGIIVSSVGGNPYSRDITDGKKEKGVEFNILKPESVKNRKKHIDKNQTHNEFNPPKVTLKAVGNGKVMVSYIYSAGDIASGAENFEIILQLLEIDGKPMGEQTITGHNLTFSPGGDRGSTDSAGNLGKDNEKHQENNEGSGFNSAHVLADQFMGSGYKTALNLLLTSAEFNQQTMAKAENDIRTKIEDLDENAIFDMTVSARFEVLSDDIFVKALKGVTEEMTPEAEAATLKTLQGKQDPKMCEYVKYNAKVKDEDGMLIETVKSETEHGDKWLKNIFR